MGVHEKRIARSEDLTTVTYYRYFSTIQNIIPNLLTLITISLILGVALHFYNRAYSFSRMKINKILVL